MDKRPDWKHYYNWPNTINKMEGAGCKGCFVVGANDLGKTFGIRYMAVKRFLTREPGKGRQFAEICRNKIEINRIADDYCTKLKQEGFFTDYSFKAKSGIILIRHDDGEEESDEPWEPMGYIVALSDRMKSKRVTYPDVGYTIFDEVVIEYDDRYHKYFDDEWTKLERLCVALWREVPGKPTNGRLFLLGNSVDIACPYFESLDIGIPTHGQRWAKGKNWLFDYPKPSDYRRKELKKTAVYSLFEGADRSSLVNEFVQDTDAFIAEKPDDAHYRYCVVYGKTKLGVYITSNGVYYVTHQLPKDYEQSPQYAVTAADNTPDYRLARKTSPIFKVLIKCFYHGNIRFSSPLSREQFMEVLRLFGLR